MFVSHMVYSLFYCNSHEASDMFGSRPLPDSWEWTKRCDRCLYVFKSRENCTECFRKTQSAKRREHMSSAQIDVAKRKLDTHDNHRKKHHTWTHIEKTHEHTTKGKHIQKAWKHTKRETQLKEFCLSFSLVFLHVGISRKTKIESTCHLHK